MDFCSLLCVLLIVFISSCLAIIFLTDSDILTFLSVHFGRDINEVYEGKVVWITGASSGIGEGLAKEFVKCKSKLVLSARRADELKRVKKECLALNPEIKDKDILVLPFDMTDLSTHQSNFDQVLKHFGQLDLLVSNAGRSQRANFHQIKMEVDKELFDLNVFSLVNLARIAVRHFLEVGKGQIAVVSSIGGKVGIPYSASYTASKFALHGYFESLRNETRSQNLNISIICPGPVFSNLLSECFTEEPGKKFGKDMQSNDKRMTAERCAHLSVVAMANKLEESWLAPFPIIPLVYLGAYQPYLSSKLLEIIGKKGIFLKLRDSRDTMKKD